VVTGIVGALKVKKVAGKFKEAILKYPLKKA
jgi:hypothetical protein